MFGAGFVMDMIQTLKNNKRERTSIFDRDTTKLQDRYGKLIDYKKFTEDEFTAFRLQLKKQEISRKKKLYVIFCVVMLLVLALTFYFLFVAEPIDLSLFEN